MRRKTAHVHIYGVKCTKGRIDDWRGGVREWGFTVTGGFRCTGTSVHPIALFPVAAHQTGRADYPHPAFGQSVMPSPTDECE
jgi:transposase